MVGHDLEGMKTSQKDDDMYIVASIPSIVFCIIISFVYATRLGRIYPPGADFDPILWDAFTYFMTPLIVFAPLLFFITFEILDSRRTKNTFDFHAKRFARNLIIQAIGATIFTSVFFVSLIFLLPFVPAGITLAFIGIAWSLLFYVVMTKLRRIFTRL